jgi:hypothetical protein
VGYIGKDVVHDGCGLPLKPKEVWENIPYSVQKGIHKAERNGVVVKQVSGTPDDIAILRSIWYDPEDPNMPTSIRDTEFMFIAYENDVPIGATILLPVGNHLFLNNLAGSRHGKELHIQDYLLWFCVNHFETSQFKYIDVGVSYRPSLYNFFIKWRVVSYPILFYPPEIPLTINDYPFVPELYHRNFTHTSAEGIELLAKITGCDEFTFFPSEEWANKLLPDKADDYTSQFPFIKKDSPCYVNLYQIFNIQFGTIVFGKKLTDPEMWNGYGCLDVFKREFSYKAIYNELLDLDKIINKRKENYDYLTSLFAFEDIYPEKEYSAKENIPFYYYFFHERNAKFSEMLGKFNIKHKFDKTNNIIALPVHQNLTEGQLDYMYGVFRGVLNLCSEWEHTDIYDEYKI